jgi:hypothetical protein
MPGVFLLALNARVTVAENQVPSRTPLVVNALSTGS